MKNIRINIAKEFAVNLGMRYKSLGAGSGEEFYEKLLKPRYESAVKSNQKLYIELDGATPYSSSFLDESFGKLSRNYPPREVNDRIEFVTTLYPHVIELVKKKIWYL